jgi:chaperonin cofactor prefoldin
MADGPHPCPGAVACHEARSVFCMRLIMRGSYRSLETRFNEISLGQEGGGGGGEVAALRAEKEKLVDKMKDLIGKFKSLQTQHIASTARVQELEAQLAGQGQGQGPASTSTSAPPSPSAAKGAADGGAEGATVPRAEYDKVLDKSKELLQRHKQLQAQARLLQEQKQALEAQLEEARRAAEALAAREAENETLVGKLKEVSGGRLQSLSTRQQKALPTRQKS